MPARHPWTRAALALFGLSFVSAPLTRALVTPTLIAASAHPASAAVGLADDTDRAAFRAWFTFLADAQFTRRTDDVTDCASLVRHAYREALRAHSPAWYRASALPMLVSFPDVRHPPLPGADGWPLFRVATAPERFSEFADATTLVRLNSRIVSRDVRAAQPGDLLYFRQDRDLSPAHVMVFIGTSKFEPSGNDWIVYHTGPDGSWPGEVRKVSRADLQHHPSPRWQPVATNPAFVGVARLSVLDRER